MAKNDIVHFRLRRDEINELELLAQSLNESDPLVCSKCEVRFGNDVEVNGKCPYCGGDIVSRKVTKSDVVRYGWKFFKEMNNFSAYDAFLEILKMNDINFDDVKVRDTTLHAFKERMQRQTFSSIMRNLYGKEQKELKIMH